MNCPNCGRELIEGEYCNCAQENAQQPQPQYPPQSSEVIGQMPPYEPQGFNPMPTINPAPSTNYPQGYKIKKKYIAVILAFIFGFIGLHNFYLENREKAIAQVLLSTVGALFVGIGPCIAVIWSLVEAIQLFTESTNADANGYKILTLEELLNN